MGNFGGQVLREIMSTRLGNDDSASVADVMVALRHKHAAAHKHCSKCISTSEVARHKVAGDIENSSTSLVFSILWHSCIDFKF